MKRSRKSKPTIVLTGLLVLSLLTVLAVSRSAADEPEGADKTGVREVLVSIIDSIFERDRPEESKPALFKTNPPVHRAWHDRVASARERAKETRPLVKDVLKETASERRARLAYRLRPKDIPPEYNFFVMNSPLLNEEDDFYGPVRFMHKKHASISNDCTVCHHYRSDEPDASETMRCSACHQNSIAPNRVGLKGAIHRQCTGCHKKLHRGPIRCSSGCHEKRVRDHTDLVELSRKPDPFEVTRECLRCHPTQGEEMLNSTHWLWKGPSPFTLGQDKRIDLGKGTVTVNNFCVSVFSNWPRCTGCHAGYGWQDATFDFTDQSRIDCLVCHDTTGTYRKDLKAAGMPDPSVDLVMVAKKVGKPSRKSCGTCHFSGGDQDFVRHGKLNALLDFHGSSCDVHMGGLGFQCHDCHKTSNHKIAGRSIALPVAEGSRSCSHCHTDAPHQENSLLTHHLNKHSDHIACVTCHHPVYAKYTPVKTYWDWSTAGDKEREVKRDEFGMPDYDWQAGDFTWGREIKPVYAWYNGQVKRYLLGDPINPEGVTILNEPVGDIRDRESKIYPFKIMGGTQAADAKYNYLLVPHLAGPGGFWQTLDWQKSFTSGAAASGLAYSGEYKWVETAMYLSLNHEVLPKVFALSCVQCHESLRNPLACGRCHQKKGGVNFKELAFSGIYEKLIHLTRKADRSEVNATDWLNFKALGYEGDPIIYGGRFKKLPLGLKVASQEKEGRKR
jgi:octaheme c-type cytochrome (tetrathionate reductase family)